MSSGTRLVADAVLPCDGTGAVYRPGVVDIDTTGRITHVGPVATSAASTPDGGEWTVRWVGGLLMPGLVNAHSHGPMTLLRGQGEGLPLDRWLREVIWPREARVGADDVYWGMTLAAAELLRFGVTTSVEMYFHDDLLAEAVDAAGSRCLISPGIVVAPGWERFGSWADRIEWTLRLRDRYAGHPRIEIGFGPHSAYALPDEALVAVGEAARAAGAPLTVHLAETEHEGDAVSARHGGATVPQVLADLGLFDLDRVLAAHGIWLTPKDVHLLAASGVAVAHCPSSNAKLASGTAAVPALRRAGIRVGLGTDGPASNNDLDLWKEIRLAALLARMQEQDPTVLPATEALDLATAGGAAALGRPDLGALARGRWADLVRLDLEDPGFVPVLADGDLAAHAVWSASRTAVRDVWVGGRQVVRDGECLTVDVAEAGRRVQAAAARLAR